MKLAAFRKLLLGLVGISLISTTAVSAITFPDSKKVLPTEAPWVVSLWGIDSKFDRDPNGFFCTGSLINPHTVITAAHCIEAAGNFDGFVVVRNQTDRYDHGQVLMPRTFRMNSYDTNTLDGDYAVIDLYNAASSNSYLKIPTKAQAAKMLAKNPTLYGWGQNEKGNDPRYLRSVAQRLFNSQAEAEYANFNVKRQIGVNRKNANGTYSSGCFGDSGGPLVGRLHSTKFLLGVVSFGNADDCATKLPVVMTRISYYRALIVETIAELKADREGDEVFTSNLHFRNTLSNPILPQDGEFSDSTAFRMWGIGLVTEKMENAVSDLKNMRVVAVEDNQTYWEVYLEFESKEVFGSDGCGFGESWSRDSGLGAQLSVQIKNASSWKTAAQFSYVAGIDECIGVDGVEMDVTQYDGYEVGEDCAAWLYLGEDGVLSVGTMRSCLPKPDALNFRASLSSYEITDIEPGFDMWAGPFDVTSPIS
jgi:secreted trypsin-like serine protease